MGLRGLENKHVRNQYPKFQEYANRILQAFDAFAKRNNLTYWLGCGTLLQDTQARAGERQRPQDEVGDEAGRAQIHRALLQQAEDALIDRL